LCSIEQKNKEKKLATDKLATKTKKIKQKNKEKKLATDKLATKTTNLSQKASSA